MADIVLSFGSNADTMIATKTLKDAGVAARMIPKPAHVVATANLALSIDGAAEAAAVAALAKANVSLGGITR